MRLEDSFLYLSLLLTLVLCINAFRYNKTFSIVNTGVLLLYGIYFLYALFFNSEYGGSLVWWFYLISLTWVHIIILVVHLFKNIFRRKKK